MFPHGFTEYNPAHAQIVSRGCLNVLMTGQLLDKRNVGAVVAEIGAVGMPEKVRRKRLVDSGLSFQFFKEFREVVAVPSPRNTGRDEDCLMLVVPEEKKTSNPNNCFGRKKHHARFAALPDDGDFGLSGFEWSAVKRQRLRNPQTRHEQYLDQRAHPQARELVTLDLQGSIIPCPGLCHESFRFGVVF